MKLSTPLRQEDPKTAGVEHASQLQTCRSGVLPWE